MRTRLRLVEEVLARFRKLPRLSCALEVLWERHLSFQGIRG